MCFFAKIENKQKQAYIESVFSRSFSGLITSKSSASRSSTLLFSLINPQLIIKQEDKITNNNIPSKFTLEGEIDFGIEKNNKIVINPLGAKNNSGEIDFMEKDLLNNNKIKALTK